MTPRVTLAIRTALPALAGRRASCPVLVPRLLLTAAACVLGAVLASARDFPPSAPPPKPFVLPTPAVRVLAHGLRVVAIERHSLPLVTLRLVVKSGAEADPPSFPGTAQLVSALLTQGTTRRTARDIAESVDSIGGWLDSGATWDSSFVTLSVLNDHVELAFDLLADLVLHSTFEPAEVERQRKQTLSALEVMHGDPAYVADTAFRRLLFAGTAYSHPEDGTADALRRMTVADLRAFYSRQYRPSNAILAVVGDISAAEAFERAEKFFKEWKAGLAPGLPPQLLGADRTQQTLAIDKPDAVQTEIRIGNPGASRESPDYFALSVANQVLGGPAANRLFKALRSRQGLTYGASSELLCYKTLGAWVAKTFTRTPETLKSLHVAEEQIRDLRDHPITGPELETAQGYLIGHQALDFETSTGVASQVLDLMIHNLPLDYWNRFPEKIQALTTEEVWNATRRYLDPEHNVIVLVGDVSGFRKGLKKLAPVRVIPLLDLDFGAPDRTPPANGAGKP